MTSTLRHCLIAAAAGCAILVPFQALGGTATANLTVSATVANNCAISTTAVAFGNYDPIVANAATALNSTGTVTVTCTTGSSPVITLGQGSNANTGSTDPVPLRRMGSSGSFLAYYLYQNTARTTVWGNTSGTGPAAVTGNGAAQAYTVYGQIPSGQNVAAGSYTDTVVATVTF